MQYTPVQGNNLDCDARDLQMLIPRRYVLIRLFIIFEVWAMLITFELFFIFLKTRLGQELYTCAIQTLTSEGLKS